MSREQRRRLLLRAHAAAARFVKREDANNYFVNNRDAFVAGWLLGYRAHRRDAHAREFDLPEINRKRALDGLPPVGSTTDGDAIFRQLDKSNESTD